MGEQVKDTRQNITRLKEQGAEAIGAHPEIEERLSQFIQMRVENTISTFMQFKNRKMESGLV